MDDQPPLFSSPEPAPAAGHAPDDRGLTAAASLAAAILAWKEHLERERSPANTVKAFIGDLNLAAGHIGGIKSVGQVSTRDLESWLQWQLAHQRCSPKTYSRRVTSLKSFFRWLQQAGVLAVDPAGPVIQQSVLSPLPEVLSEAELAAALTAAEGLWRGPAANPTPYVLFTLLIRTGIKKGECLGLDLAHVDLSNPAEPVLWVRHPDPRHRYKERKLALDLEWLPAYRVYLTYRAAYLEKASPSRTQVRGETALFPWSPRRLEYWLRDISEAAQLEKQISFDMCRWTCAVREVRAGLEATSLRQKLGLSKIQWREIGMKLNKLTGRPL